MRTAGNFRDRFPTAQSCRTSIEAANRVPSAGWGVEMDMVRASVERGDKYSPVPQRHQGPYRLTSSPQPDHGVAAAPALAGLSERRAPGLTNPEPDLLEST